MITETTATVRPRDVAVVLPFAAVPTAVALDALFGPFPRLLGFRPFLHTVLIALVVAGVIAWLRPRSSPPRGMLPLLTLMASFLPGMAFASLNPYSSAKVVQLLVLVPVAVLGAIVVFDRPARAVALLWVFGMFGLLVAGLALVDPDPSAGFRGALALRNSQYITTARIIGHGVVALLVLALLTSRRRTRVLTALGAALATPPLLMTGSRGPVAAVVVAVVVLLAWRIRWLGRLGVIGAAVVAVVAGAPALLAHLPAHLGERFGVLVGGPLDVSAHARISFARYAADTIASRPLGVGWGDFWEVIPLSMLGGGPAVADDRYRIYPHNLVLEVGAEGGWVALLGLAIFAVAVVRALAVPSSGRYMPAIAAMLAYVVVNAMVSSDVTGNILVWVLAGAALAAPRPAVAPVPHHRPSHLAHVR